MLVITARPKTASGSTATLAARSTSKRVKMVFRCRFADWAEEDAVEINARDIQHAAERFAEIHTDTADGLIEEQTVLVNDRLVDEWFTFQVMAEAIIEYTAIFQ